MKWMAVLSLVLAGCNGQSIADAPAPGATVNVPAVEWRVVDRATLESVYLNSGKSVAEGARLEGFAGVTAEGRAVIYTLPPRAVDDDATCTLGHEFMHVALGNYHGEK